MADRWMDDRDRDRRDRDWPRQARFDNRQGAGGPDRYGENRSFSQPRSDYDPYAEYRDDYDDGSRARGWQDRHYGGVSPAMRQNEYELGRGRGRNPRFQRQDYTRYADDREQMGYRGGYGRQAYDEQGWGEPGFDAATPEERPDHDSAAYKAGDFLGRAGRRVAEFFSGHDGEARSFRGHGPKGYKRSDARISEDVHDRLTEDHWLDAREITVAVESGEVTLSGTVSSREDKRRAERIVEEVSGVDHVQNNLRVAASEAHTAENESWQPDSGSSASQN